MAERKAPARISHAEIKAGVFLTFCLALFIAMLFVLGKFGHAWRGRQEISVIFTQVNAMRPDAPVFYNGMDIGHVSHVKIVRADADVLSRLPAFGIRDLSNLPLGDEEREVMRRITDASELDHKVRTAIIGRTMVVLVLDVLRENDTQRFHTDDEYRISGSLMGDSAVDIRTGSAQPVSPGYERFFLGINGDMYSDLGKSISQVKDILGSMAEIVGGEGTRENIRSQVDNFDNFTGRLENVSGSVQTKLPTAWNNIDERLESGKATLGDIEVRLGKMKPQIDEALLSAQKAITETREGFAKSVADAHEKVKAMRAEFSEAQTEWRKTAAEYREIIPARVHEGRELTERVGPTMDKINAFFTRADDQLDKGIESTRAMLGGYTAQATEFEFTTFQIKKWPSSFANKPTDEVAESYQAIWRRELAARQFLELRNELDRIRESSGNESSDKARVARLAQLIRELDGEFQSDRAPVEAPKKGRK